LEHLITEAADKIGDDHFQFFRNCTLSSRSTAGFFHSKANTARLAGFATSINIAMAVPMPDTFGIQMTIAVIAYITAAPHIHLKSHLPTHANPQWR
jgi:hypothetical protein